MFLLIVSVLALFAAPPLYAFFRKNDRLFLILDGFIFVAIGGLIVTLIMPHAFAIAGWLTLVFLAAGMGLPALSERIFHYSVERTHLAALFLGILGLGLHALTDGAAIGAGRTYVHSSGNLLALGVLLHRIPIGLTIWWFVRPRYGTRVALFLLALIGVGTCIGFALAPAILVPLSTGGLALFQAFVAGSLLHIVLHRSHVPSNGCSHGHGGGWWEGLGNGLGAALALFLIYQHNPQSSNWFVGFRDTFVELALESAPALLLAYIAAGFVTVFMPQSYIRWVSGGSSWRQSLRGVAVGLPLPVCSCGVVPLYHSMIRKGVPPAAAMAFLIATPELGIDAIFLSLPLLGGTMTGVRVAAAAIVALLIGSLIGRLTQISGSAQESHESVETGSGQGSWRKLRSSLTDGLGELVDHTGPWILVGMLIAAALHPVLQANGFGELPPGLEVPLLALLGIPLYVCASGATPLVAVLLANGVSPGAALAFLLTGPATNFTTFGVLTRLHGRKIALLFGLATFAITVGLGYLTNLAAPTYQPLSHGGPHRDWSLFHWVSLVLLALLYMNSLFRRGAREFVSKLFPQGNHHHDHVTGRDQPVSVSLH